VAQTASFLTIRAAAAAALPQSEIIVPPPGVEIEL